MVYANTPFFSRVFTGIYSYLPFLRGLGKEIVKNNISVVHLTSSASFGLFRDLWALKITRKKSSKSIVHFRFGRIPDIFKQKGWEYRLIKRVIKKADSVIVLDKLSYMTLINYGYSNIVLLPNPLTPKVLKYIENNKTIERQERKILFAGHVITSKGVFELVEICKAIPNIKVKLIGNVSEDIKTALYNRGGKKSNDWLNIAGEKDFETTIKEMLSAGIFVLPTYTEGFPNVIIESMACGCPIVTTKVGAIPEMLDIENGDNYGLCIEPKNEEQLRSAILRMINDREFALRCGRNAQERVNKLYSMPIIWSKLESIWHSVSNQ
ncbi:MAG: glycosyltransferase family 4 protein [Bacteroidales bacterium]|nr:glycosyltransferase family 4 protein [Bacteroidales bacterium]